MYKITQSLLSSWYYATGPEAPEDAYSAFLLDLCRKERARSAAAIQGDAFENMVWRASQGMSVEGDPAAVETALKIGRTVHGAQWQVSGKKSIKLMGEDIVLVGRADVIRFGTIYDIKRPLRYEYAKYFDSPQHPMYFEIFDGSREFSYQIFDGSYFYEERYTPRDCEPIQNHVKRFYSFLKDSGLWEIYKENWRFEN